MKYNFFLIAIGMLSLMIFSCADSEDVPLTKLEGTYTGTFQRTIGNESGGIAQVSITFNNNNWEGQSDTRNYPALCKGTYQVKGQIVNFENHCMFTADFDWSLVLKGDYKIAYSANIITLTKVYPDAPGQIKDVYTLQPSATHN